MICRLFTLFCQMTNRSVSLLWYIKYKAKVKYFGRDCVVDKNTKLLITQEKERTSHLKLIHSFLTGDVFF